MYDDLDCRFRPGVGEGVDGWAGFPSLDFTGVGDTFDESTRERTPGAGGDFTGVVDTLISPDNDKEGDVLALDITGNTTLGDADPVRRDIACGIELDRRLFAAVGMGVALGERFFRRLDIEIDAESASEYPEVDR